MGHHRKLLITSLNNAYFIRVKTYLRSGGYCYYKNDISYKNKLGILYNWYAVDSNKLCPNGWHVPSKFDWETLSNYLVNNGYGFGGSGDDIAKALASNNIWQYSPYDGNPGNDTPSNNITGFSGLPSGIRTRPDAFQFYAVSSYWWSSTEDEITSAWSSRLEYNYSKFGIGSSAKDVGYSVRCIKD